MIWTGRLQAPVVARQQVRSVLPLSLFVVFSCPVHSDCELQSLLQSGHQGLAACTTSVTWTGTGRLWGFLAAASGVLKHGVCGLGPGSWLLRGVPLAGVAASFALVGLGTDTGNSVRGPAAHTGLVGLRPSLGLTSR
jgi:hypothetical protein